MREDAKLLLVLSVILLHGATDVLATDCREDWDEETGIRNMYCKGLKDTDLPLPYAVNNGTYYQLEIVQSQITRIPKNGLGSAGITAKYVIIDYNQQLEHLEPGFLGENPWVENLQIIAAPKLRDFPWDDLLFMRELKEFKMSTTGLVEIPSDIFWPEKVERLEFGYNDDLRRVATDAFLSADSLKELSFYQAPGHLTFEEDALFTSSAFNPEFRLSTYDTPPNNHVMFADNAFGNTRGGYLWGTLNILGFEFREGTFRKLLQSAFAMNVDHLFKTELGPIQVHNCTADCSMAWLYEDAHKYGLETYLKLIGPTNVICPYYGPLLESSDARLINHFNDCIKKH